MSVFLCKNKINCEILKMYLAANVHKPKCRSGRAQQNEIWLFGMADCKINPALGLMQIVERRRAETTIYTDQWAAYNHVENITALIQQTVIHMLHFNRIMLKPS
jgi:hypothetical protein